MRWFFLFMVLVAGVQARAAEPSPAGFPGVRAPALTEEDRAAIDVEIVDALERHAPVRTAAELKQALTLTRESLAAKADADAAELALAAYEFETARTKLGAALDALDAAGADALDPDRVIAILEAKARVASALGRDDEARAALERMARLAPDRELEAKQFPPETIAIHTAARESWATEISEPTRLSRAARAGRVRWIVVAKARVTSGAVELGLSLTGDDGRATRRSLRVPTRGELPRALAIAFDGMFAELGVPSRVAKTAPTPPPTPVPPATPFYKRWYVLGAAAAILASGAAIAASSGTRDGGNDGGPEPTPTPDEPDVIIVFPNP